MRKIRLYGLAVFLLIGLLLFGCAGTGDTASRPGAKTYDVVIQNGSILDGSGSEPFTADVGIKNGYIVAIGRVHADADRVIDAKGRYITPGFIDIHTHCWFMNKDKELEAKTRSAANYLYQGVTTVVSGNCGSGLIETAKSIEYTNKHGAGPNMIHLIGHGSVRGAVMGSDDREPTPDEMQKMKKIVRDAMEAGAFGMSSGLYYAPGSYAKTEEVIELAKVVAEYGGIYATHIRDEGSNNTGGLIAAIKEAIQIGEEAGVPVEISHIKGSGRPAWNKAPEVTRIIEDAQKRGLKIYADQYPYRASSTKMAAIVVPRWVQAGGKMRERFKDPSLIDRIKKGIGERIEDYSGAESLMICSFPEKTEYEGKNLAEISEMMGKNPVDAAIDMMLIGSPGLVIFAMIPEDVEYFMQKPYIMTGSDGSNIEFGSGVPHPRHYGAFTHKIRHYALDKGLMTWPEVIRKATGLPADMLGLKDRGLIRTGCVADVLVIDPETVGSEATFTDPHHYATGIDYMFINGRPVIEDGTYNNALVGKALRHKKEAVHFQQ